MRLAVSFIDTYIFYKNYIIGTGYKRSFYMLGRFFHRLTNKNTSIQPNIPVENWRGHSSGRIREPGVHSFLRNGGDGTFLLEDAGGGGGAFHWWIIFLNQGFIPSEYAEELETNSHQR